MQLKKLRQQYEGTRCVVKPPSGLTTPHARPSQDHPSVRTSRRLRLKLERRMRERRMKNDFDEPDGTDTSSDDVKPRTL